MYIVRLLSLFRSVFTLFAKPKRVFAHEGQKKPFSVYQTQITFSIFSYFYVINILNTSNVLRVLLLKFQTFRTFSMSSKFQIFNVLNALNACNFALRFSPLMSLGFRFRIDARDMICSYSNIELRIYCLRRR